MQGVPVRKRGGILLSFYSSAAAFVNGKCACFLPGSLGRAQKSPGGQVLSGAGCSFKKVRLFADHKEDQSVLILFGNGNAELSRVLNTGILQNSLKFASILLNGSS